jgi:hypothetical protein
MRKLVIAIALCFPVLGALPPLVQAGQIVNIDATLYGYQFPTDPAPVPGQLISPFSLAPGGALNQLTLSAGTYAISNATGLDGADPNFTGWRFNSAANWVWSVVIADDATDKVVFYADRGGVQTSQATIASDPGVQSFHDTFTILSTTTLDFMIRDYFLPDNAGGVAVIIQSSAVPEPSTLAILASGALVLLVYKWRRSPSSARTFV